MILNLIMIDFDFDFDFDFNSIQFNSIQLDMREYDVLRRMNLLRCRTEKEILLL